MVKSAVFYFLNIVVFTCILSCKDNNSEDYFYLSQYEARDMGYPYGAIIYTSTEKLLFQNIVISGNVIDFKKNQEFITAKQQLDKDLLRMWISESISSFIKHNGYNNSLNELEFYNYILPETLLMKYNDSLDYLTSIVLNSSLMQKMQQNDTNYWLIRISNDSLMGPFSKLEFEVTRQELKISDRLKLD